MPLDPTVIAATLPPGWQLAANVILFLIAAGLAIHHGRKGVAQGQKNTDDKRSHDAVEDVLDSSVAARLLTAIEAIAVHVPLLTEALKIVAAAATAHAKAVEEDFDTLRIFKAVHDEIEKQEEKRQRMIEVEEDRAARRRRETYEGRESGRTLDRSNFPP